MPIYEYRCESCGKHFEIFQKISDSPLTECKFCKGRLSKLISNCSFHLKGSGWYVTDYKKPIDTVGRSPSPTNGSSNVEKTESKTDSVSPTSTETKKDTNTETKVANT